MDGQATAPEQSPMDALAAALGEQLPAEEKPAEDAQSQQQDAGADEPPGESQEVEPSAEDEGQAEKQPEAPQRYKVRVKGDDGSDIEEEHTLEELQAAYMRQADYTRKTQEVSRQKQEFQQHAQQALAQELGKYGSALQQWEQAIMAVASPELAGVDWDTLAVENPAEYVRLSNRARQVNDALGKIRSERDRVESARREQFESSLADTKRQAAETLQRDIKGFSRELYGKVLTTAVQDYGLTPEQAGSITHPGLIKMAHDAMLYRQGKQASASAKSVVEKKVTAAPPVVKPGARVEANERRTAEAAARLRKTGSVRDLAAAMAAAKL